MYWKSFPLPVQSMKWIWDYTCLPGMLIIHPMVIMMRIEMPSAMQKVDPVKVTDMLYQMQDIPGQM